MNVRKEDSPVEPSYPDAKEFLKYKTAIRAAILGAGMAVGGCAGDDGNSLEGRTGGVILVEPGSSKDGGIGDPSTWKGADKNGKVEQSHQNDEVPRLPGKAPIEPQRLPGSAPMNPNPPEY